MKKIIFAAMVAAGLALPSCSSDEVQGLSENGAISFSVASPKNSRNAAAWLPNTTDNLTEFHVWGIASNNGDAFFMNHEVTLNAETKEWGYGALKFWPNTGSVNFFGVAPKNTNVNANVNGTFTIDNYVADGKTDLIYSFNLEEKKQDTKVVVNFRHALANLLFMVNNINPDLRVTINEVKVVNVKNTATFSWATKTTTPWYKTDPYESAENKKDTELKDGTWGSWTLAENQNLVEYKAPITDVKSLWGEKDQAFTYLSSTSAVAEEGKTIGYNDYEGLFVMPQKVTSWDFTDTTNKDCGSYFAIKCKVVDKTGTQLWPATQGATDYVLIPVPEVTWKQGKRYVYKISFGEGAGYTPGENPEPVLRGVYFTVTVDEFQTEDPIDVDMNKRKDSDKDNQDPAE